MNKITELFENMPIEEVLQAISEMKAGDESGFICDGVVRKYAKLASEISGQGTSTELMATQIRILKIAAYRYESLCKC